MDVNDTTVQDDRQLSNQQKPKKCHGNRRDQRFRRKCRARGMKAAKTEKLLNKLKQADANTNRRNEYIRHITNDNKKPATAVSSKVSNQKSDVSKQPTTTTPTINLNKRKRKVSLPELKSNSTIPKSTSSISIIQSSSKTLKKKRKTIMMPIIKENNNNMNTNYQRPMYLKQSSLILFQMLRKKLNYPLKDKDEQQFIYRRLDLLDKHYCLEVDLQLWQSYLELGIQKHRWPEQLSTMAKTDNFDLCQRYLINYIEDIKKQINQYEIKLTNQSELCPITSISFEQMDQCLKEFVDCQRKYLLIRNNNQVSKFTDDIMENELFEIITTNYPTIENNRYFNQLITIRQKQAEIYEELLQLEMRILCKFLPSNFEHLQYFVAPFTYVPLNNEQIAIQLNNKRYKMIQEAKRQWLYISLSVYEIKLQEYDQQYQETLLQLESMLLNNSSVHFASVFNYISRYTMYRTNQLKQDIINKMSGFRGKLLQHRQRSPSTKNIIGVSPEPYLDLNLNPFNALEWHHLSLGPSYIRSNQSALRPQKQQEIEIKDEYKEIYKKVELSLVSHPHRIPLISPLFKQYSNQLRDYLQHSYFNPLSYKDHIQAREQAQTTTSIRLKAKQNKLIIRVTDKSNNFYIGSAIEFEKKVQKYFSGTNAFTELSDNPFNEVLNKVVQLLNNLREKKYILQWQFKEMMPNQKTVELAHLYFNPKTHKDGIPIRPIENTIRAPTTNISKLLDKIIRPIFDDKCSTTTIIDGAHLIIELQKYISKGLFKPTTLFCTFDIHNLYTMLPQDESLNILIEFLHVHGYRKVKGIPLDTLRKLASIVLKENVFVYDKKIYKQTIGGAMGSSFTLTLANIFMWKWQKELVRRQDITGEFYGRYIDDILMTWNRSERELKDLLETVNTWHPNIKLDYKIAQSLPFLDVLLTNNNGILLTSVFHKPSTEPYVIPFISDHPRHVFGNIIQTTLTRAARYSSTFEAFNYERRCIKLMLLYNGYPSTFIDHQFAKFFDEYIYPTAFLPIIEDEKQFALMRHEVIDQPTPRQSQVATNVATANVDNNQTDDTEETKIRESTKKTEKKPTNYGDRLIIHYKHESRFQSAKRDMHKVYENVFKNTPAMNLRLIVGNRNRRDAKNELIRKRPKRSILQNQLIKNKYLKFLDRRRKAKRAATSKTTSDLS